MDDLIAFLRARLDEREQIARAAEPGPWRVLEDSSGSVAVGPEDFGIASDHTGQNRASYVHIAANDPARVLADVDAKRRIIELHSTSDTSTFEGRTATITWCPICRNDGECPTLRLLALPYADHPDYRGRWRP